MNASDIAAPAAIGPEVKQYFTQECDRHRFFLS